MLTSSEDLKLSFPTCVTVVGRSVDEQLVDNQPRSPYSELHE